MSENGLTILTWHSIDASGSVISISPRQFSDQMAAITDTGYRGISLQQALTHREVHAEWPARAVVLTFDDGYENFVSSALPAISRHGFSATVYLISRHIEGYNDWGPPPEGLGNQRMLSWAQVREMVGAGIEIGAHTCTHPDLRRLGSARAREEIAGSRNEIEDQAGCSVTTFAFPFGYRSETADDIVRSEFTAACTTQLRRASSQPLHELPRIDVYYLQKIGLFSKALDGSLDRYLTIRRLGRIVRNAVVD